MLRRDFIRGSVVGTVGSGLAIAVDVTKARGAIPQSSFIYVSTSGDDSNDGLSWSTAKANLEGAVAACPAGGTVYVGPGFYMLSNGVVVDRPVNIVGASGDASGDGTVFVYTPMTGAAITLACGNGSGTIACPILANFAMRGPGSTTSTCAIQISTTSARVQQVTLENLVIGAWANNSVGFGTGIYIPLNMLQTQNNLIVNPAILGCGVGAHLCGEMHTIVGGSISQCTHSIIIELNTDVTCVGVSMDTNTGTYVINNCIATFVGCHFETNDAPLATGGFIKNLGILNLHGGYFCFDAADRYPDCIISTEYNCSGSPEVVYQQHIAVLGTNVLGAIGGSTKALVTGPTSGGGLNGIIAFRNNDGDNAIPPYDGVGAGRVFVIGSVYTGGIAASQFYGQGLALGGATPAVGAGEIGLGTTTSASAGALAGYLVINISGVNYNVPYYQPGLKRAPVPQ